MLLPETFTLSSVLLFAFIGFVIGFFFHHIILYFYTREQSYLYYAIYTFALSLGILSIADGMAASWGKSYDLIPIGLETLFLQFYHVALILFTLHINNIQGLSLKLYRFSLYVAVVSALGLIFLMFGDEGIFLTSVFSMIAFVLSLSLTVYALYRDVPESKYYFIAFSPFLIIVFIHVAAVNAMLDFTDDFSQGVVIGAVWNISALAILIAQKIRLLSDQKDRALLENAVHNATLFLHSRNAAMGELVADIAHQWKQPLNAIASVQNALKASIIFGQNMSHSEWLEATETSIRLVEHLGNTIDTFYRFLTPKVSENRSFCITDQFITIERLTEYAFKNSNITLKFHYDSHPTLAGDPNEFVHVLLNIILNAKEVLENNEIAVPYIDVALSQTGQGYVIRVADNGGGIKIEPIKSIFDRYISSKNEGGGLGLYMANEIIKNRFGGSIIAENSFEGAVFTIKIPYIYSVKLPENEYKKNSAEVKKLAQKVLELEQVEEELRLWEDIFKQAHWAIAIYVPGSFHFNKVNDAFCKQYGYTTQEIPYMTTADLYPDESIPNLYQLKTRVDTMGYDFITTIHKRKDGSTFPVSVEVMVIKNSDGTPRFVVANIWDKTDEYKNINHIQMLGQALDITKEAVYLVDKYTRFAYVNEGACTMLGYTKDEFLTMEVGDIDKNFTVDFKEAIVNDHNLELVGQYHHFETVHTTKEGREIPVEIASTLLMIGNDRYGVSTVRDISERVASNKQLNLLNTALDRTSEAIYLTDETLTIIYVNAGACAMLGYNRDELIGMSIFQIEALFKDEDLHAMHERLLNGEVLTFDTKHLTKCGQLIDVEITANMFEYDGQALGLSIVKNISERKQSEEQLNKQREALQKSEAMFRAIVENSPDAISRYDLAMRRIYVNPLMHNLLAKPLDEILGKTPREFSPLADLEQFEKNFQFVLETKTEIENESIYRSPWGEHRWGVQRIIPEIGNDGTIHAIMVVGKDITPYKQTLLKLQNMTMHLSALVNTMPDMVWMKDPDGIYLTCNHAFEEFFGAKSYEIIGKTDYDFVDRELADFFRKKDNEAIEKGTMNINQETITYKSSGTIAKLETRKVPVYNPNGELLGVLGIGRDISAFFAQD